MGVLSRLLVFALLCAGCGRVGFDAVADGDVSDDDEGSPRPGVFVQAFEVTMDAGVQTITIELVDLARTMILCDYRTATSSVGRQPACELVDARTVRLMVGIADPSVVAVVQVVQLPEGSVVQRGVYVMDSGEAMTTIPVGAFPMFDSFPLISRWGAVEGDAIDPRFLVQCELRNPGIDLVRTATGNTLNIPWQAVHIAGARGVSVGGGFGPGTASVGGAPLQVDLDRSFAIVSFHSDSSEEASNQVRTEIVPATGFVMNYRRGTSGTTSYRGTLIELPDVTVTHGVTPFATEQAIAIPVSAVVDPTKTMVILSVSGGRPGELADHDDIRVTGTLAPGSLELRRSSNPPIDVGGIVAWSVVAWP